MTKISALSDIGTSVASNDTFVLVDVSDPTTPNKKIQQQNLFLIPDGSFSTPGLRFLNDIDSGIFRDGSNTFAIATGGSERLRIDSSGRLGLGTSSPSAGYLLDVRGSMYMVGTNSRVYVDNGGIGGSSVQIGVSGTSHGYIGTDGNFPLVFQPNNTERVRITSAGLVGIGTTNPSTLLHLDTLNEATAITVAAISSTGGQLRLGIGAKSSGFQSIVATGNGLDIGTTLGAPITFFTNGTANERARIDSSGRLLVGTSASRAVGNINGGIQFASSSDFGTTSVYYGNSIEGSVFSLGKSRATAVGSLEIVQTGDTLGEIRFAGDDGTDLNSYGACIRALVDGTPGVNDMPGMLLFETTADGANIPAERLRITSAGVLQVADAGNIAVGTTTGTKIGTATTQKLGFFNKTPVVQPAAVADATDAASVITQLNALLARMRDLGLIAT